MADVAAFGGALLLLGLVYALAAWATYALDRAFEEDEKEGR